MLLTTDFCRPPRASLVATRSSHIPLRPQHVVSAPPVRTEKVPRSQREWGVLKFYSLPFLCLLGRHPSITNLFGSHALQLPPTHFLCPVHIPILFAHFWVFKWQMSIAHSLGTRRWRLSLFLCETQFLPSLCISNGLWEILQLRVRFKVLGQISWLCSASLT